MKKNNTSPRKLSCYATAALSGTQALFGAFSGHLACAAALVLLGAANLSAAMTPGLIEVGAIKGQVTVALETGSAVPLLKGAVLNSGAKISSVGNSTAELFFANGARVLVQPNTELVVSKFAIERNSLVPESGFQKLSGEPSYSNTLLSVNQGKILVEVQKLRVPISEFKVKTPLVVVDVKGTAFFVEQTSSYAKVGNVRGSLAVSPLLQLGAPVVLSQEQTVVFHSGSESSGRDGAMGAVITMDRSELAAAIAQLSGGAFESPESGEFTGPARVSDEEFLTANSLILLSPNGEGQVP